MDQLGPHAKPRSISAASVPQLLQAGTGMDWWVSCNALTSPRIQGVDNEGEMVLVLRKSREEERGRASERDREREREREAQEGDTETCGT